MERFLYVITFFVRYFMPPIIGGLIGLFTNWLAIQMLFHPYKAVYIGMFRLPFTPGIIPKRKESVAHAIGVAVAEEVLTEKELSMIISSPAVKEKCISALNSFLYQGETIASLTEKYDLNIPLTEALAKRITEGLSKADIESTVTDCLTSALKSKPVLSFVINEKLLTSIAVELSFSIKRYLQENGAEIIEELLRSEAEETKDKRIGDILIGVGLSSERTEKILYSAYDAFTKNGLKELFDRADVASIIEKKINDMDVKQIADLTFKVMKREMRAVVYLGGLLGALIGVINIFI